MEEDTKTICFKKFRRQNLVPGVFVFETLLGIISVNLEENIFQMGGSTADVLRI